MQLVRQTILGVCALATALTAVAEQRSMEVYDSIVQRNPFGLKDPPVIQTPTNKPAPDIKKEDFYLTGISTIGDSKRPKAYLLNKDASKKNYDEKYFTLSAGDKQGELAVKEIDPKGRRVLIAYQGEDRWLSMKDNGVPAPTGPAPGPGGMPLVPGAPGAIPPPPGAVPMPLPGGAPVVPQPLNYPNAANPNRRTPRSVYNGAANNAYVNPTGSQGYANPGYNSGYNTPTVAGAQGVPTVTPIGNAQAAQNLGPQTDGEMIEQMAGLKSPIKLGGVPAYHPPPPPPPF